MSTQPSALGEYFRRKRARDGTPPAITDTAHKMARIIYHLVTHRVLRTASWPANDPEKRNGDFAVRPALASFGRRLTTSETPFRYT